MSSLPIVWNLIKAIKFYPILYKGGLKKSPNPPGVGAEYIKEKRGYAF